MEVNVGMVFAIILTLIIIGFLLVVGIGQISDILGLSGRAQVNKAITDLEKVSEDLFWGGSAGSSRTFGLKIPAGAKICFIDTENPGQNLWETSVNWKNWDPEPLVIEQMIANPVSEHYQSSIWFYYQDAEIGEGYKINYLKPREEGSDPEDSFCAIGGKELYMEHRGMWIDISTK